jgi:signal transduction histidine kinase/CheY-like chemotaxis protein
MATRSGDDRRDPSLFARYGVAFLASAAAAGIHDLLLPLFTDRVLLSAFPAAVAVAAWYGGFGPGLLATLSGSLVAAYMLWQHGPGAAIGTPGSIVTLALLTLAGVMISVAIRRFRREAHAERDSRIEIERRLRQTDRLQEFTAALSRARTSDDVIGLCFPELLHAVEAEAGALFLTSEDGSECELAQAVGFPDRDVTSGGRCPITYQSPVTEAIARRDLIVAGSSSTRRAQALIDPLLEVREGDVVFPLLVGPRAIGAVALRMFTPGPAGRVGNDEREFLLRIGRHIAQALDRARLYETAERGREEAEALRVRADSELRERQKAEEALRLSEARYRTLAARTSRLYALSAGLSQAVTLDAVAKVIVRHGKVVVGASAGSVYMLAERGTQFDTLYAEEYGPDGVESPRRFPAAPGLCSTAAVETRRPVFVGSFVEWQEKYPRSASIAADGGYASSAALPLLADGAVLGVLSFHFTVPVNFDDEYGALLTSVAQHCAQALDRARLYETTERARADAEAANRSKDDFLSTISHELRTPLNAILGWAAMLRSGSVDASRTQRAIDAIFNNATRQGRLIEELLDVSRIVAGRASFDLQTVDLSENIRGAVESMMPSAAAKGVEVRFDAAPDIHVVADPRRLEQVFLNLLSNAVKFTPRDGHISVDVTASDETAEVRVVDTGVGIDPSFLPHVFERFRQADSAPTRTVGGLGLGLFISRQLTEGQGGTIRVESDGPGRGATFILTLRSAATSGAGLHSMATALAGQVPDKQESMPSLDSVRVLIVDDEPDAQEVMASALESCGATVMSAGSARDALETLRHVDIDLLLSDIAMPGQDGYELIRAIRAMPSARLASIPAAAVTAHARDDERERALAAGFHLYLTKPVHPAVLARAVASLASGAAR